MDRPKQDDAPQSKWEAYARVIVAARFPSPPHHLLYGTPRVRLPADEAAVEGARESRLLIPDVGVFDDAACRCVVEVGELSRPDKLFLWEKYLPGVTVWWLPKSEILEYLHPAFRRFRFHVQGVAPSEGLILLEDLTRFNKEIHRQHLAILSIGRSVSGAAVRMQKMMAALHEEFGRMARAADVHRHLLVDDVSDAVREGAHDAAWLELLAQALAGEGHGDPVRGGPSGGEPETP